MKQWNHGTRKKLQKVIAVFLALFLCIGMPPLSLPANAEDAQDEPIAEQASQEEAPGKETPQESPVDAASEQKAAEQASEQTAAEQAPEQAAAEQAEPPKADTSANEPATLLRGRTLDTRVNVRAEASTQSEVVATIEESGTEVDVLETIDVDGEAWYRVRHEGVEGFIRGDLIAAGEKTARDDSAGGQPDQTPMTDEQTWHGADYTVRVSYGPDAGFPEGTELTVREILSGTDEYDAYRAQALESVDAADAEQMAFLRFFDIAFMLAGEEIEPQGPVSVDILFSEPEQGAGDVNLLHITDEGVESIADIDATLSGDALEAVRFDADGFSVFGVMGLMRAAAASDKQPYDSSRHRTYDMPSKPTVLEGTDEAHDTTTKADPDKVYTSSQIDSYLTDADGKMSFWTSTDKSSADVVISFQRDLHDALFLASLCGGHSLSENTLNQEITAVAKLANLNLYLEGRDMWGAYLDAAGTARAYQTVGSKTHAITEQRAHTELKMLTSSQDFKVSSLKNTAEGSPTYGSEIRIGEAIKPTAGDTTLIRTNGGHSNMIDFALDVIEAFKENKNPDFVVISYDPWNWATASFGVESANYANDAQVMRWAAELLAPYYAENRVVWLVDNNMINSGTGKVKDLMDTYPAGTGFEGLLSFLYPNNVDDFKTDPKKSTFFDANNPNEGSYYKLYSQNFEFGKTTLQERDANTKGKIGITNDDFLRVQFRSYSAKYGEHVSQEWAGNRVRTDNNKGNSQNTWGNPAYEDYFLMSKRLPFYQFAILDPVTYLTVTDANGIPTSIPGINSWNRDVPTQGYKDANAAKTFLEEQITKYDEYRITDTLAEGLKYDSAEAYYLNESKQWVKLTSGVTISHTGQNVNVNVADETALGKRIRVVIHTKCEGDEFVNNNGTPKQTNSGEAEVKTHYKNDERVGKTYTPPTLRKVSNRLTVKKNTDVETTDDFEFQIKLATKTYTYKVTSPSWTNDVFPNEIKLPYSLDSVSDLELLYEDLLPRDVENTYSALNNLATFKTFWEANKNEFANPTVVETAVNPNTYANGSVSFTGPNGGYYKTRLKKDAEFVLNKLPNWCEYEIVETAKDGWTLHSIEGTDNTIAKNTQARTATGIIDANEAEAVTFTNHTYKRLTVSKTVTGNMGNKAEYFPFTIKVNRVPGMTTGEFEGKIDLTHADTTVPATAGNGQQTNPEKITIKDGAGTATVYLQHGQSFSVTLPEGTTYTISEPNSGYEEWYKVDSGQREQGNSVDGALDKNQTIAFENNKDTAVPTGVHAERMLILAGLLLSALLAGVLFAGRRRRTA